MGIDVALALRIEQITLQPSSNRKFQRVRARIRLAWAGSLRPALANPRAWGSYSNAASLRLWVSRTRHSPIPISQVRQAGTLNYFDKSISDLVRLTKLHWKPKHSTFLNSF